MVIAVHQLAVRCSHGKSLGTMQKCLLVVLQDWSLALSDIQTSFLGAASVKQEIFSTAQQESLMKKSLDKLDIFVKF